jgi:pimeloyl-ACP methyl ester carboxylesterase
MIREFDVSLGDRRVLHAYDTGTGNLAVFWHHGTPNIGTPPRPLFEASQRLGIRWVSYDRPGYGGSTPKHGRSIETAAEYVAAIADSLGIDRFAVMGHSGGGPHALACAALMPARVQAAVSAAGLAPFQAPFDWYAGMCASGLASLTAAGQGREAKESYQLSGVDYDPEFTPGDLAALNGDWAWLNEVVGPAVAGGPGGLIDDDVAYVTPWTFDPAGITAPILLLHGEQDRVVPSSHSKWLASACPTAELRLMPDAGHISVLGGAQSALEWLSEAVREPHGGGDGRQSPPQ